MRHHTFQKSSTFWLTFAGTLFLVGSILAAGAPAAVAVELVDPLAVLEETRRSLNEFDQRMKRYKAERQKEEKELEARQKQEEVERQKREIAEKALEEARRKREAAEQQKRAREEKDREARQKQEEADREKRETEKALQEAQRKREDEEKQKRAGDEEGEAQLKQEAAEREKSEKALQEAQRKREAAEEQKRARDAADRQARPNQRDGLRGRLFNRVDRRSACQQKAEERGLSGRMARRYTRLCLSGLPIPDSLRR